MSISCTNNHVLGCSKLNRRSLTLRKLSCNCIRLISLTFHKFFSGHQIFVDAIKATGVESILNENLLIQGIFITKLSLLSLLSLKFQCTLRHYIYIFSRNKPFVSIINFECEKYIHLSQHYYQQTYLFIYIVTNGHTHNTYISTYIYAYVHTYMYQVIYRAVVSTLLTHWLSHSAPVSSPYHQLVVQGRVTSLPDLVLEQQTSVVRDTHYLVCTTEHRPQHVQQHFPCSLTSTSWPHNLVCANRTSTKINAHSQN